jgi:hypothetical protein
MNEEETLMAGGRMTKEDMDSAVSSAELAALLAVGIQGRARVLAESLRAVQFAPEETDIHAAIALLDEIGSMIPVAITQSMGDGTKDFRARWIGDSKLPVHTLLFTLEKS